MPDARTPPHQDQGLETLASPWSVAETIDRLEAAVRAHGATVFARIDHAAAAAEVGLTMRPTQVLVFGNPRIGTPVMQAAPTVAIDLPFKALAHEDEHGAVWLSYNRIDYLARRHGISPEVADALSGIAETITALVEPRR